MRDTSSFAAAMSSGVRGPFFARTTSTCPRLSNAAAKTSPGFPVVSAAAMASRKRTSRLVPYSRVALLL
ncbi:uncharacterized protein EI90DRAFT_3036770 [Cantharellus anzutake]|uniref:uncharacterized protein n=1 Tax=Cantharellus anzutake TaxID=1750568 RepID=UPI0019032FEB|nr:uncharacterized protein EI90DRAFT_3036770 [Cantharellus anzutake]KAF8340763.1 hypothetical protein EI90DRAFT_3036770 [Cantharellus anzutake]